MRRSSRLQRKLDSPELRFTALLTRGVRFVIVIPVHMKRELLAGQTRRYFPRATALWTDAPCVERIPHETAPAELTRALPTTRGARTPMTTRTVDFALAHVRTRESRRASPRPGPHDPLQRKLGESPESCLCHSTPSMIRMSRSAPLPSAWSACWYAGLSWAAIAFATLSNSIMTVR